MNVFSVRFFCILACLGCLVAACFVATYLSALNGDWLSPENLALKLCGVTALISSLYFIGCAAYERMLWIQLFRNKELLCMLGSIAALVAFLYFMLILPNLAHMRVNLWLHVLPLLLLTLLSAICFSAGTNRRVFGFFSLISSLPLALLSIGPILFFFFPPPPDPVGGNGINVGIQLMLMIPFAIIALPTWIISIFVEQWRITWHIIIGLFCLPGSVAVTALLLQVAG